MNNDTADKECQNCSPWYSCYECNQAFAEHKAKTNNDTPADAITVTQADRDLVYSLFWFGAKTELEKRALEYIRDGKGDDARAVQEVARHRTTSLAAQDGLVEARDTIIKEQAAALAEHVNTNISLRKQLEDARSEALEEAADRSCHHCDPLIRALKGKS